MDKKVVLHYLRIHEEKSYKGVADLASEMDRVRALLQLPLHGFPDASTLYRSFNQAPIHVWKVLLNRSAALLERSGHGAVDATVSDRNRASSHYSRIFARFVETHKVTFLIDTADQAIINVDISAKWQNDAKIGPKITARNTDRLINVVTDIRYDSPSSRE